MENKLLNDNELKNVTGGWDDTAPKEVRICPKCGGRTQAGIVTGHNPTRGMSCCMSCDYSFEIYLDGPNAGQKTGRDNDTSANK